MIAVAFEEVGSGDVVVMVNCHFDHVSPESRREGAGLAQELALALSKKYSTNLVYVVGDFNCSITSP